MLPARFQTYFPHIDNVYSHRSTQKHKRKRFVSHYWDCRLKGRPPGTKKSTDPEKKKRKRVARERDLCDVKIKITEFWDVAEYEEQMGHPPPNAMDETATPVMPGSANVVTSNSNPQEQVFFGQQPILGQPPPSTGWDMSPIGQPGVNLPFSPGKQPVPRNASKKFYTFQRVNGNGGTSQSCIQYFVTRSAMLSSWNRERQNRWHRRTTQTHIGSQRSSQEEQRSTMACEM